jgi:hypothetical protein
MESAYLKTPAGVLSDLQSIFDLAAHMQSRAFSIISSVSRAKGNCWKSRQDYSASDGCPERAWRSLHGGRATTMKPVESCWERWT